MVLLHVQITRVNVVEQIALLVPAQPIRHANLLLQHYKVLVLGIVPIEGTEPRLENVTLFLQTHGSSVEASLRVSFGVVKPVIQQIELDLTNGLHKAGLRRLSVPLDERNLAARADDEPSWVVFHRDDEGNDWVAI